MLPTFKSKFKSIVRTGHKSEFQRYFLAHLANILASIENIRITEADACRMPICPIHCDFHPGNLKYQNNRVVAIFDLDWSKIDFRLFDLSMAVDYFCSSWGENSDGELRLDRAFLFLNSYQEKLYQTGGMKPLNTVEIKNLPGMLSAANLCIVNWIVTTFHQETDLNDHEYLDYLKHSVRLMYFIAEHRSNISQMASELHT